MATFLTPPRGGVRLNDVHPTESAQRFVRIQRRSNSYEQHHNAQGRWNAGRHMDCLCNNLAVIDKFDGLAMPFERLVFGVDDGQEQPNAIGYHRDNCHLPKRNDAVRDILPDKHGNRLEIQRRAHRLTIAGGGV